MKIINFLLAATAFATIYGIFLSKNINYNYSGEIYKKIQEGKDYKFIVKVNSSSEEGFLENNKPYKSIFVSDIEYFTNEEKGFYNFCLRKYSITNNICVAFYSFCIFGVVLFSLNSLDKKNGS